MQMEFQFLDDHRTDFLLPKIFRSHLSMIKKSSNINDVNKFHKQFG
jgi:hypothetical protein